MPGSLQVYEEESLDVTYFGKQVPFLRIPLSKWKDRHCIKLKDAYSSTFDRFTCKMRRRGQSCILEMEVR
jgi:hypothetical protein